MQPEPLPLTESQTAQFLRLPRHLRCHYLLSVAYPNLLQSNGIDPSNCGFSADIVAAATVVWLAWSAATRKGAMLSGRPSYEAQETLFSRVRSSLSEASGGDVWASRLYRRLNLNLGEILRTDAAMWWMSTHPLIDPQHLRQPATRELLTVAIRQLIDWQSHLYLSVPDEDES